MNHTVSPSALLPGMACMQKMQEQFSVLPLGEIVLVVFLQIAARENLIASAASGFLPSRGIHSIPGDKKSPDFLGRGALRLVSMCERN
jgi:hypothetical protein